MRITDGTETMEVSVREYGDHSDREITDQTLPSLVEWAETPGIVENVRRTAQRLVELFANDGKNARTILGYIPDGAKLGLGIRLYAPDIRDDGRGLPDDIRLTQAKDINRMFMHCERLRRLDISNLELPPDVKTDDGTPTMFSNCVALEHVDMPVRGALSDRYGEMMKRLNAGDRAVLKARPYPRVTILAL